MSDRPSLVRPHVVTEGRAYPSRRSLELGTIVVASGSGEGALSPEKRGVVQLCRGGALSVAEVAGYLRQPISVTKVLVSDLLDSGHLAVRAPSPETAPPTMQLLQELLDGLEARL